MSDLRERSIEDWTGTGCRYIVQVRTWAGVVKVGEANNPVMALMHGKAEALSQIASGKGWSILSVEVVDNNGEIVLGEEAAALTGEIFELAVSA